MISNFTILAFMLLVLRFSRKSSRLIISIYCLSTFYYGLIGPAYWIYSEDSGFLGVHWGSADILSAASLLNFTTALVVLGVSTFSPQDDALLDSNESAKFTNAPFLFIVPGGMGLAYVLFLIIKNGANAAGDPFLLIAYQFSDLLIPALLFLIARNGLSPSMGIGVAAFSISALYLGFRYKAMLILFPLTIWLLSNPPGAPRSEIRRRRLIAIILLVIMTVSFSTLTLIRKKYDSMDFADISQQSSKDFIYGLFAESNIIFGLVSIKDSFVQFNDYIGIAPITDSIKDFLPRFIDPDRETNRHIAMMLDGLIARQGMDSGTAYPYLGEYLMMAGLPGLAIGCLGLIAVLVKFRLILAKNSSKADIYIVGTALLAVYFGYYYYSRGIFSQAVKGVVFIIIPYLYLAKDSSRKLSKHVKPQK